MQSSLTAERSCIILSYKSNSHKNERMRMVVKLLLKQIPRSSYLYKNRKFRHAAFKWSVQGAEKRRLLVPSSPAVLIERSTMKRNQLYKFRSRSSANHPNSPQGLWYKFYFRAHKYSLFEVPLQSVCSIKIADLIKNNISVQQS